MAEPLGASQLRPSDRTLKGKLYHFCSKELARTANKRAEMILRRQQASLIKQTEHMVRVYKLDRLKMTKELLAIAESASACSSNNFNKYKYPCFWDPDVDSVVEFTKPVIRGHVSRAAKAKEAPPMLYGEVAYVTPGNREGEEEQDGVRRSESESSLGSEVEVTASQIMENIRRIKTETCAREPRQFDKKVITMGRFVNEFEWLDTRHTQWFMDTACKVFHRNLMSDVRQQEEKDRLDRINKPSEYSQFNVNHRPKPRHSIIMFPPIE